MSAYQIIIQGTGIELPSDGETVVGFFTTRIARGKTPDEAVDKAFSSVMNEWHSEKFKQANLGDVPKLKCDRIREINWMRALLEMRRKGYIFYPNQ